MGDEQGEASKTGGNDFAVPSNEWHLNTVLSTSLKTPGAAIEIPLEGIVEVRGIVVETDNSPAIGASAKLNRLLACLCFFIRLEI